MLQLVRGADPAVSRSLDDCLEVRYRYNMKRKVGTVLEEETVKRVREAAAREGLTLSAFIEEALEAHLKRKQPVTVEQTRGMFQLTAEQLEEVLSADLYDD